MFPSCTTTVQETSLVPLVEGMDTISVWLGVRLRTRRRAKGRRRSCTVVYYRLLIAVAYWILLSLAALHETHTVTRPLHVRATFPMMGELGSALGRSRDLMSFSTSALLPPVLHGSLRAFAPTPLSTVSDFVHMLVAFVLLRIPVQQQCVADGCDELFRMPMCIL